MCSNSKREKTSNSKWLWLLFCLQCLLTNLIPDISDWVCHCAVPFSLKKKKKSKQRFWIVCNLTSQHLSETYVQVQAEKMLEKLQRLKICGEFTISIIVYLLVATLPYKIEATSVHNHWELRNVSHVLQAQVL